MKTSNLIHFPLSFYSKRGIVAASKKAKSLTIKAGKISWSTVHVVCPPSYRIMLLQLAWTIKCCECNREALILFSKQELSIQTLGLLMIT
jgi:hypothetical protein